MPMCKCANVPMKEEYRPQWTQWLHKGHDEKLAAKLMNINAKKRRRGCNQRDPIVSIVQPLCPLWLVFLRPNSFVISFGLLLYLPSETKAIPEEVPNKTHQRPGNQRAKKSLC